jgi:hypothetical protein
MNEKWCPKKNPNCKNGSLKPCFKTLGQNPHVKACILYLQT